jgi:hypothetical protein
VPDAAQVRVGLQVRLVLVVQLVAVGLSPHLPPPPPRGLPRRR